MLRDDKTQLFEQYRSYLEGLAYRMLGSIDDAADIVQDTYLKWIQCDSDAIQNPRAWLITVCSRIALNFLQSARRKRENYVGIWLPEPYSHNNTEDLSVERELDETLSMAFLRALESLSPAERAVYLLNKVFDYSFDEISDILNKKANTCRQLARRARNQLRSEKPRFRSTRYQQRALLKSFLRAINEGDVIQFQQLLSDSIELHSDGGGNVNALPSILRDRSEIVSFFLGIWKQYAADNISVHTKLHKLNGDHVLLIYEHSRLSTVLTINSNGKYIERIFAVRNPDKLKHCQFSHN